MQTVKLNNGVAMVGADTGFRDFADPNYLRRIIGMFNI